MIDSIYLYIIAISAGSTAAYTKTVFRRGGVDINGTTTYRKVLGTLSDVSLTSLLIYPFLVYDWYVGLIVPVLYNLLVNPVIFYKIRKTSEGLGYLSSVKPFLDLMLVTLTLYLWISFIT
jgi:hypothetical protein